MAKDGYLTRVGYGAALGAGIGGAVGAVYGTYEAVTLKVPGLLKIRYIGRATGATAGVFALFMGAGTLIRSG